MAARGRRRLRPRPPLGPRALSGFDATTGPRGAATGSRAVRRRAWSTALGTMACRPGSTRRPLLDPRWGETRRSRKNASALVPQPSLAGGPGRAGGPVTVVLWRGCGCCCWSVRSVEGQKGGSSSTFGRGGGSSGSGGPPTFVDLDLRLGGGLGGGAMEYSNGGGSGATGGASVHVEGPLRHPQGLESVGAGPQVHPRCEGLVGPAEVGLVPVVPSTHRGLVR